MQSFDEPQSIFGHYGFRKLVARKFEWIGLPAIRWRLPVEKTIEDLIVSKAQEDPLWGYYRMVGALANLQRALNLSLVAHA